jgi:hypothetical protein
VHSPEGARCQYCHAASHIIALCASPELRCSRCRTVGHHDSNPLVCTKNPEYDRLQKKMRKAAKPTVAGTAAPGAAGGFSTAPGTGKGAPPITVDVKYHKDCAELRYYDWRSAGLPLRIVADAIARYKYQKKQGLL